MNESLSHYCCAYWPSFRSLPLNSDCLQRGKPQHCLAVEDRPSQNGFHINIKHIQGVGCEYGRVFTLLPLLSLAKLLKVSTTQIYDYLPRGKAHHSAVVEAIDPFKMAFTSISNTYKVFHNLHMLWMCIWLCFIHIAAAPVWQIFWELHIILVTY